MLAFDVEAVDVVERSVIRLGDYRETPPDVWSKCIVDAVIPHPLENRITHHTHAVRVGNHHRPLEKTRFLDPGGTGHLTVSIQ